jgi:hypothetical protein
MMNIANNSACMRSTALLCTARLCVLLLHGHLCAVIAGTTAMFPVSAHSVHLLYVALQEPS